MLHCPTPTYGWPAFGAVFVRSYSSRLRVVSLESASSFKHWYCICCRKPWLAMANARGKMKSLMRAQPSLLKSGGCQRKLENTFLSSLNLQKSSYGFCAIQDSVNANNELKNSQDFLYSLKVMVYIPVKDFVAVALP